MPDVYLFVRLMSTVARLRSLLLLLLLPPVTVRTGTASGECLSKL
jgi:hypothetical protein